MLVQWSHAHHALADAESVRLPACSCLFFLHTQTNPEEAKGEPPKLVVCDADLLKVRLREGGG
jgi:hypothetical protein